MKRPTILLFLFVLLFSACGNEDERPGGERDDNRPLIVALVNAAGLGDGGYNDDLYRALLEEGARERAELHILRPADLREADSLLTVWRGRARTDRQALFLVLDEGFAPLADRFEADASASKRHEMLLLQSARRYERVYTRSVCYYGVSYLWGRLAARFEPSLLIATEASEACCEARDGFTRGVTEGGGELLHSGVLASDVSGFTRIDDAYRFARSCMDFENYSERFIYPFCGGAAKGVFRALNDEPWLMYTVCLDADYSAMSTDVVACVQVRIGALLTDFIDSRLRGDETARCATAGMESEYLRVTPANEGFHTFDYTDLEHFTAIAREVEKAYLTANQR